MLFRPTSPWTRCLRVLALGLVVVGLLLKPVQALSCGLDDLHRAAVAAGASPSAQADDDATGDACCLGQRCGDCCAVGVAVMPSRLTAGVMPLAMPPRAMLRVGLLAPPRSEMLRPPIAS